MKRNDDRLLTLIIDDEEDSRETLRIMLDRFCPNLEVVEVCASAQAGMRAIETHEPDLVMLDIQMPGMTGFDLLAHYDKLPFHVIIVSAHAQFDYGLKALRSRVVDYLTKPVSLDDLFKAIQLVKDSPRMPSYGNLLKSNTIYVVQPNDGIKKVAIPTKNGHSFLKMDDILYFESDGNYTKIQFVNDESLLATRQLGEFEEVLRRYHFQRVHHSYLVNLNHIQAHYRGNPGYVVMTNKKQINVSRKNKDDFLNRFGS